MAAFPPDLMLDARTAVRVICGAFSCLTRSRSSATSSAVGLVRQSWITPAWLFRDFDRILGSNGRLRPHFRVVPAAGRADCRKHSRRRGLRHCPRTHVDVALATSGHRIHAVLGNHLPLRWVSPLDAALTDRRKIQPAGRC